MTQWKKVFAGPAWYMERTNSSRLSFEFHMCSLARGYPHKSCLFSKVIIRFYGNEWCVSVVYLTISNVCKI